MFTAILFKENPDDVLPLDLVKCFLDEEKRMVNGSKFANGRELNEKLGELGLRLADYSGKYVYGKPGYSTPVRNLWIQYFDIVDIDHNLIGSVITTEKTSRRDPERF